MELTEDRLKQIKKLAAHLPYHITDVEIQQILDDQEKAKKWRELALDEEDKDTLSNSLRFYHY